MEPLSPQSFVERLVHRALAFSSTGIMTFVLDLSIMSVLYFVFNTPYPLAIVAGFLTGITVNYALCYLWVYRGTRRKFVTGFLIFVAIAVCDLLLITHASTFIIERFSTPLIAARVIAGSISGSMNFALNTFFNFKLV
jgi:putative flippase GtrA